MSTEYGVGQRSRPGLHRGPWSKEEAEEWVREAELDGCAKGAFFVISRTVGPWGPHGTVPPLRPDPNLIDNAEGNKRILASDRAAAEKYLEELDR